MICRFAHARIVAGAAVLLMAPVIACESAATGSSSGGAAALAPPDDPFVGSPSTLGHDAPCPGYDPPQAGMACDEASPGWDLTCEYGHDLDPSCNDVFECERGAWSSRRRSECFGRCPASIDAIVPGTPCVDTTVGCSYLEGTCACVPDDTDGGTTSDGGSSQGPPPGTWRCAPPPGGGCPPQRPPLGSDCVRSMTCDYGSCELSRELAFTCHSSSRRWIRDVPNCD